MNIIFIIVDALRPDHLGINGYSRKTSPNIDVFAKEGARFLNAYTVLSRTSPSVTSILTGLYPHNHGIRMVSKNNLADSVSLLPDILRNHGYKSAYIGEHIRGFGLEHRFDDFLLTRWRIKNKIKKSIYIL